MTSIINNNTSFTSASTSFNYPAQFDLMITGKDPKALARIHAYFLPIAIKLSKQVRQMKQPMGYTHKLNQSNMVLRAKIHINFVGALNIAIETGDIESLKVWQSHNVLNKGYFGPLSNYDKLQLLQGKQKNNSNQTYRGLANFQHPNYGVLSLHPEGILLTLNGTQSLLRAEEAHRIIHAGATGKTTHFQRIPFSQYGIFPTQSRKSVNMDGVTMVFKNLVVTDIHGEVLTHKGIRLSLSHTDYTTLVYSIAFARNLGEKENAKFALHADITTQLFGKPEYVPANLIENTQWWYLYTAMYMAGEDNTITRKSEEAIQLSFRDNSYLSIRGMHCVEDILDPKKVEDGLIAYEAETLRRAEERAAKIQEAIENKQEGAAPKNSTQTEEDIDEQDILNHLNNQDIEEDTIAE